MSQLRSTNILGVRIHNVTMGETLAHLERMALSGSRHYLATVNAEWIVRAQHDELFRTIINGASLSIPDGMGVLLASRLLGQPINERVTGVDTVRQFAAVASRKNLRIFMLGSAPGVAERAARALEEENPGLRIAGTYSGSPDPREDEEIRRCIEEVNPHVLLVAYGAPKQDFWIHRNLPHLKVSVAIGVGGTFDFIAGVTPRAPLWVQSIGLEWLHRLVQEPRRWRRMMALPKFVIYVLLARLTGSHATKPNTTSSAGK